MPSHDDPELGKDPSGEATRLLPSSPGGYLPGPPQSRTDLFDSAPVGDPATNLLFLSSFRSFNLCHGCSNQCLSGEVRSS